MQQYLTFRSLIPRAGRATDQNGNVTAFAYDFYGNMGTSTNGAGEVSKITGSGLHNCIILVEIANPPPAPP